MRRRKVASGRLQLRQKRLGARIGQREAAVLLWRRGASRGGVILPRPLTLMRQSSCPAALSRAIIGHTNRKDILIMAKSKTIYVCSECGYETPRWLGRCPDCGSWNTLTEQETAPAAELPEKKLKRAPGAAQNHARGSGGL